MTSIEEKMKALRNGTPTNSAPKTTQPAVAQPATATTAQAGFNMDDLYKKASASTNSLIPVGTYKALITKAMVDETEDARIYIPMELKVSGQDTVAPNYIIYDSTYPIKRDGSANTVAMDILKSKVKIALGDDMTENLNQDLANMVNREVNVKVTHYTQKLQNGETRQRANFRFVK